MKLSKDRLFLDPGSAGLWGLSRREEVCVDPKRLGSAWWWYDGIVIPDTVPER